MYVTETRKFMVCETCAKEGIPHPEADGSLGLVHGWLHYDPKWINHLAILPDRRIDFCSVECRDKWLDIEIRNLRRIFTENTVIYQFSHNTRY